MVATRNHPSDFPAEPTATSSPTKRSTRAASARAEPSPTASSPPKASPPDPPTGSLRDLRQRAANAQSQLQSQLQPSTRPTPTGWAHTPSNLTLLWLAISLPLVIWDTGYVMLRPLSMPGGRLHAPIWSPYGLYGTIDHTYGFKAYDAGVGFTAAQGSLNAVETVAYLGYLWLVYAYGHQEKRQGTGAPDKEDLPVGGLRGLAESRTVYGRVAAGAVVLAYTTSVVTFSKTVLYWLNEAFSGFGGVGHNSWGVLFWMWIVPNGLWLIFPAYMCYVFGQEMIQGLEVSTVKTKKEI